MLLGFIIAEMFLTPLGPNLAPGRKEAAVSKGMPTIAKSRPSALSAQGSLIKFPILQKRGEPDALGG